MDLSVNYNKATSKTEAYELAKAQITPEYVDKFNVKAEIEYNEAAHSMKATGKGFTLDLQFEEDRCDVSLKLSLILKPLKKKILGTIEKKLEKNV
ncbi:polyhydroxyalkanoic acid system family protein [Halobacteriovorax sp. JY17]|uniref:polyhydroxyalkanoic acid system family protein n=1 Tax=Halobacteriovorax sp. JY17 TaxID=2014617 RepID=UPI000C5D6ABD|nr:polyhydroxyalkanoic acid system family protein [Halobacteriovorax sp. JY17]PIK15516.1 MAG: hypothetical protein CES88_01995 [Halobacteriovorax sp. JY17]